MNERLAEAVREFTRTLLSPFDREDVLDRLLQQTLIALDAAGAGIMLADESGELAFAAASDERVEPVELAHNTCGGACHDAYQRGVVVAVEDITSLDNWPRYTERALAQGFAAVLRVPLVAWGRTIGVLNVYRDAPTTWTDADVKACQIVAGMGAAYILNAEEAQAQQELSEHLQTALRSRGIIEQAKGIIMASQQVDGETAFKTLRQRSQHRNRKLRDIAADIARAAGSRTPDRGTTPRT